jgi:radical SAM superfamily enzyme YgiQ (UPF0313 family)
MKVLLVYPEYPETFWSFKSTLKIIGKKAAYPPLGLLTVAAMLPKNWQLKLVDMNVSKLKDKDIEWADMIMMSAMIVQKKSVKELIPKFKSFGKKIVAGGPLFTTGFEEFKNIDCLMLGEGEETLKYFLKDLKNKKLKKIYKAKTFPTITKTVAPKWDLINLKKYNSMSIQYSRGCPFNCEFCDIVRLNGRVPRLKLISQIINELNVLYKKGWRDPVFFVDDNFIGNKEKLKKEILPAIIKWQKQKDHPFVFNTQASVNLADDEELMKLMVESGFRTVFVGIETPDTNGLEECGKFQNKNRSLLETVKKMQLAGLEVQAGFILGFDSDTPTIFQRQIDFIQKSGIVTAMVGLLTASPMTRLYYRLKETGRLLTESTGNNTSTELNFIPKMDKKLLVNGYKKVMTTIYEPKEYYQRVKTFLRELQFPVKTKFRFHKYQIRALFGSFWFAGIQSKARAEYWKLLFWSLFKKPKCFSYVITYSLMEIHFRKVCFGYAYN